MKKHNRTLWVILLVAAIIGAWAIWKMQTPNGNSDNMPAGKGRGGSPLHVNVEILKRQTLTDEIQVTGLLIPDEEVNLSFETSGKVVDIYFKEGAKVSKGQLLAKVNDATLQAQLRKMEAQLPLAEDRVYRQTALLQRDAVSKEALEQVKTELESLKADIELVKAQIALTELRAPFDGIIGLRQVSVGAYASPTTIVSKLTRISPLKVEFSVPERYSSEVGAGQQIEFTIDGCLDPFHANVYACESAVDVNTHSLQVRALYSNSDGKIKPGRYAGIKLTKRTIEGTLAVPSQAIVPEMGKDKVFVYRNGVSVPVEIQSGIRTESQVQALSGLNEGDTLIISGTLQLRTELPVVIDNLD